MIKTDYLQQLSDSPSPIESTFNSLCQVTVEISISSHYFESLICTPVSTQYIESKFQDNISSQYYESLFELSFPLASSIVVSFRNKVSIFDYHFELPF